MRVTHFLVLQVHQANHDGDPVKHVRKHGSLCKNKKNHQLCPLRKSQSLLTGRAIRPAKDRAEDGPSLPVELAVGVAAVQMPHIALDPVGARPIAAGIVDVCAKQSVERVLLERTDSLAEQPGTDEEQEIGHDYEEDRECCVMGVISARSLHEIEGDRYLIGWQIRR